MKVKFNLQPDVPNVNGHIYPKEELQRAFTEYDEICKSRPTFGILKQPTDTGIITENTAAFKLNHIDIHEDGYVGDIDILTDTDAGKKLTELLTIEPEKYRIVTMLYGNITKVGKEKHIINGVDIISVGIEPKEKC